MPQSAARDSGRRHLSYAGRSIPALYQGTYSEVL